MRIEKSKTVCFSGHRTKKLPQSPDKLCELEQKVYFEIDKAVNDGFDTFIMGACEGFDLICARQVIIRQKVIKLGDPHKIKLIAAIPYEEQAKDWTENLRDIYYNTLAQCDETIMVNIRYKRGCYFERNRFMVDNSSRLICYCNNEISGTKYTLDYAKKQGLEIINLK